MKLTSAIVIAKWVYKVYFIILMNILAIEHSFLNVLVLEFITFLPYGKQQLDYPTNRLNRYSYSEWRSKTQVKGGMGFSLATRLATVYTTYNTYLKPPEYT